MAVKTKGKKKTPTKTKTTMKQKPAAVKKTPSKITNKTQVAKGTAQTRAQSSKKTLAKKTPSTQNFSQQKINEFIQTRAYFIWEELGRPQGQDVAIWQRAEQEITSQFNKK